MIKQTVPYIIYNASLPISINRKIFNAVNTNLTKGSRHMEGESPPTYGGINFLRFGDEITLGHGICKYL